MNAPDILFTVEEAFMRVGQIKGTGCLLIFIRRNRFMSSWKRGAVIAVEGKPRAKRR